MEVVSRPRSLPDLKNLRIKLRSEKPVYLKTFKWLKNRKNFWKKVRTLYNKKLPNEDKSDIKTYQNAQIYYERETSSEDFQEVHTTSRKSRRLKWKSSGRLPGSRLVHYIFDG
ncbi:hypothetical protein IGI04_023270 [Brassica rapa subsp. trilocularis]|uniref:Uncharacterized protein n=1 Tax=Brassica rapa subsp. trilocularis TaxID=1813537 RepID=A0ABQ7M3D5_BRACM|nr:hypothetical protein IGI04_023270 [Brassica rapa subsp. trilocularis]